MTDDFRVYHRVAPFFEEHGIHVLGLRAGQEIPAGVVVVMDGDDNRACPVHDNLETTLLAVLQRLAGKQYRSVVFGVDPGRVSGVAVLADGEVLLAAECLSPEAVAERVAAWHAGLAAKGMRIQIGSGDPLRGAAIIGALAEEVPHLPCRVVSEEATTPPSGPRHKNAAVQIARR